MTPFPFELDIYRHILLSLFVIAVIWLLACCLEFWEQIKYGERWYMGGINMSPIGLYDFVEIDFESLDGDVKTVRFTGDEGLPIGLKNGETLSIIYLDTGDPRTSRILHQEKL